MNKFSNKMESLFDDISLSSDGIKKNSQKKVENFNLGDLDINNSQDSWDISDSEKEEIISINLKSITEEEKSFSLNIEVSQKNSKKKYEEKIIHNYIDNDESERSEFSLCSNLKEKLKKKKVEKTQLMIKDNLSKRFLNKKMEELKILLEKRLNFLKKNKEKNSFMIKQMEGCLKLKKNKIFYVYCLVQSRYNK